MRVGSTRGSGWVGSGRVRKFTNMSGSDLIAIRNDVWLIDRVASFLVTLSELLLDHSLEDPNLIITTTLLNMMSRAIMQRLAITVRDMVYRYQRSHSQELAYQHFELRLSLISFSPHKPTYDVLFISKINVFSCLVFNIKLFSTN